MGIKDAHKIMKYYIDAYGRGTSICYSQLLQVLDALEKPEPAVQEDDLICSCGDILTDPVLARCWKCGKEKPDAVQECCECMYPSVAYRGTETFCEHCYKPIKPNTIYCECKGQYPGKYICTHCHRYTKPNTCKECGLEQP